MRAAATGGEAQSLLAGRVLCQGGTGQRVAVKYVGTGQGEQANWGVYLVETASGNSERMFQIDTASINWVRLSPDGTSVAVPFSSQGKSIIVFYPAQAEVQETLGQCSTGDLVKPACWTADGTGVIMMKAAPAPAGGMMGGGMMGPGMMGGGMGGGMMGPGMMGGMGMGMGGATQTLVLGKPDATVTDIVKNVGLGSFGISVPNSSDIAAMVASAAPVSPIGKTWPGEFQGVYVYTGTGTERGKLTRQKAVALEASPNGRHVAMVWGDKAPYTLSVIPLDGSAVRRLAFNVVGPISGCPAVAWSPDSRYVAYGSVDDKAGNGIMVVDIQSGASQPVSNIPPAAEAEPADDGQGQ
jgi:WD40 repeat protein